MINITGLWSKKDKNGNPMMSGKLGSAYILITKNIHKKEDKHPDYVMSVVPPKKKEEQKSNDF